MTATARANPAAPPRRLLAVDLPNLISRCWYATPPTLDDAGNPAHAIAGAVRTIVRVLRSDPCTHVTIATDSRTSFRKRAVAEYKAHRKPRDPDLIRQELAAADILGAAGWPVICIEDYEADDVLASVAAGFDGSVCLLTGDKDMLALVDDRVTLRLLRSRDQDRLCTLATSHDIFGVAPDQVTDFKALAGDKSDGIPGVTGIGDIGAARILGEFGSLAAALEAADLALVKPDALRRKLQAGRQEAAASHFLASMVATLAVEPSWWATLDSLFNPAVAQFVSMAGYPGIAPRLLAVPAAHRDDVGL